MTIHQGEEQMLTRLAALSEVGAAGHVGPGEVVGPVDDVQHTEHRGKHDPEARVTIFKCCKSKLTIFGEGTY